MTPTLRLRAMFADVRAWARTYLAKTGRDHRKRRDALLAELSACERVLGEGVDSACALVTIPDALQRAATRLEYADRRDAALTSLTDIKSAEDRRWLLDRNFDAAVSSETCRRAFFTRLRSLERTDSHMPTVTLPPTADHPNPCTYNTQRRLNEAADRFYGSVPGGLFNLPFTPDPVAEQCLFGALAADGTTLPSTQSTPLASFEAMFCSATVKAAITGLSLGAVPGVDGFPSEFLKLFVLCPSPPPWSRS
jgi:hypothetical protein